MPEFFPVLWGVFVGTFFVRTKWSWMIAVLLGGFVSCSLSGELLQNSIFLLVDTLFVSLSALAAHVLVRELQRWAPPKRLQISDSIPR
jgi:hypothetical protein